MVRTNKVNVIKVPLKEKLTTKMNEFPRMPRMYLELLENKDKIKPNLVNQEYDPDDVSTQMSEQGFHPSPPMVEDDEKSNVSSLSSIEEEEMDQDQDQDENMEEEENEYPKDKDDIQEESSRSEHSSPMYPPPPSPMNMNSLKEEIDQLSESFSLEKSVSSTPTRSIVSSHRSAKNSNPFYTKNTTREQLQQILNPPKLSDLERAGEVNGKKVIPNLGGYEHHSIEQEDELKRELLYKYDILRRSYRHLDIPEFSMHSDYRNMNRTYESTLRRISLDSNVENYKNYMIVAFMVLEYVLGTWFKFDMAGFTQQQILNMTQYERLLIELGEKSYVPTEKQWPVEIRLLGLVLLNTVIFLIAKIMIKKTGTNLFGLLQTTLSPQPSTGNDTSTSSAKPKRKMKGPNIDLQSIPDILQEGGESVL